MNSAVWEYCVNHLPDWIDVIVVDLPGHGTMSAVPAQTLDDHVQSLITLSKRPTIWIGWSLGGLVVLRLAQLYPERVAAAMLVSTNPCFVKRDDWDFAVEQSVFEQFAANLKHNQEKTIQRFLALQVKGVPGAISVVRQLQNSLSARGSASADALVYGLNMLLDSDFRSSIKQIDCPLYWLLGGLDALVPVDLANVLRQDFTQPYVSVYDKAGHAPFLSQPEAFIKQLLAIAQPLRDQRITA